MLALVIAAGCGAPSSSSTRSAPTGMPFAVGRVGEGFAGRVVAVQHVDGYSYVAALVDGEDAPRQLVSLHKDIVVGDRVDVRAFGLAEGFVSRKLGRTFERLWFVVLSPSLERVP